MKQKTIKRISLLLALFMLITLFTACGKKDTDKSQDIVILYTNDAHCGIDENIGYAGLASYKKSVKQKNEYVTLVDCGDALQGELIGTVSKGEYPVDIMNNVGYDFAIPGNHEFDYGMDRFSELMQKSNTQYLGCNIAYSGNSENKLSDIKPYEIKEYGKTKVAFIGVLTPENIAKSTPSYFQENGEFVYGFNGDSGASLYAQVQKYIDECNGKGADYVVILSHLGDEKESSPFTSTELIENTTGIDVVLDGHSHRTISSKIMQDKNSDKVIMSSTGTKLNAIGQLVITESGYISTGLISDYSEKDNETEGFISNIKTSYEADMNRIVASSDIVLSGYDANGIRLVRNRETTIGNFCADAYRAVSGADIALVNGGGIRADLKAGDISYADIIAVHPFGNMLCVVKATGQEILDCLEMATRFTTAEIAENGNAKGEDGGFQQVSGIKYTIDTSIPSSVSLDENGMFVSVANTRRVSNVQVLQNGEYVSLELNKTYTVASSNYMIKKSGGGFNMFNDNELVIDEGMLDNQVLISYITKYLQGKLGEQYLKTEDRITVK